MTNDTQNAPGGDRSRDDRADRPDQEWLYEQTNQAIAADPELVKLRLRPLNRFNTDVTGRSGFIKIYYGISCDCSTAAVLSVEAAADKSRAEFQDALPVLLGKLKLQAEGFRRMDCDSHLQMRIQNFRTTG